MFRVIRFIDEDLPALLLAIMVIVLSAEVFARYVMGHSIIWAPEVATICFIWQVYLAAVGVMRRRRHVTVNLVRDQLSGRGLALFDVTGSLIVAGALALTGWQAWTFVSNTNFSPLPATGLSRRVLADAVLVGCAGMLIHAVLQFAQASRGAVTGRYDVVRADPLAGEGHDATEADRS